MACVSSGLLAEKHARRKASSILTACLFSRRSRTGAADRRPGLDRGKRPRIVRRVTFVQPPARNMSHRFSVPARWHGCCSYPRHQRHSRTFGKQASQGNRPRKAGSGTKATRRTPRAPDNNEKTLLHTSKRPTTPHPAGFFFAARSSVKCPPLTRGGAPRAAARVSRASRGKAKKEAAIWLPRD